MLLVCPFVNCHYNAKSLSDYDEHLKTVHSMTKCDTVSIYQDEDKIKNQKYQPLICKKCRKMFANSTNARTHEEKCAGGPMIACGLCNKAFENTSSLIGHVKTHEIDEDFVELNKFRENIKEKNIDKSLSLKNREFLLEVQKTNRLRTAFTTYTKISPDLSLVEDILTALNKKKFTKFLEEN